MIECPIPLVLLDVSLPRLRRMLRSALAVVEDRNWAECDRRECGGVRIRVGSDRLEVEGADARLLLEREEAVLGDCPSPADVLRSWLDSTGNVVAEGLAACVKFRERLVDAARLMTLACALSGRNDAMGYAHSVMDNDTSLPICRFGWHDDDYAYEAPSELVEVLERVCPTYRCLGESRLDGAWTILRDRMAAWPYELDAMWMLRHTARIPLSAIEQMRSQTQKRWVRL